MKGMTRYALIALAAALILAADTALTWRLASERGIRAASAPVVSEAEKDPIEQFRLEREQLRARQEAQLNDIIHSEASDAQIVADAQSQLLDMLECARSETAIEGVLRSRGFDGALVSVGAGSASVLVRREALTRQESAVILELVMRQTGLTGGTVKIIPVK